MTYALVPMPIKVANSLVAKWHRHHKPVVGALFAIGLADDDVIVGAVIVGRPVARMLQDGYTAEVVRCVTDGSSNACSMLYGAAWRAWKAMGGHRIITYILESEPGTSLRAAGWEKTHLSTNAPNGWSRPSRVRLSGPQDPKQRWEKGAA